MARAAVRAAKFPPIGGRSYGGRRAIDRQGRNYSSTANQDVLLVVQIESPEAIDNVDAIAATEGVDALFLGPDDILLRRGVSPAAPRSQDMLARDMAVVANTCKKHNKFSVMVGVGAAMLNACLEYGYNMIVVGGDVSFLANGSTQASADARAVIDGRGSENGRQSTLKSPTEKSQRAVLTNL